MRHSVHVLANAMLIIASSTDLCREDKTGRLGGRIPSRIHDRQEGASPAMTAKRLQSSSTTMWDCWSDMDTRLVAPDTRVGLANAWRLSCKGQRQPDRLNHRFEIGRRQQVM